MDPVSGILDSTFLASSALRAILCRTARLWTGAWVNLEGVGGGDARPGRSLAGQPELVEVGAALRRLC